MNTLGNDENKAKLFRSVDSARQTQVLAWSHLRRECEDERNTTIASIAAQQSRRDQLFADLDKHNQIIGKHKMEQIKTLMAHLHELHASKTHSGQIECVNCENSAKLKFSNMASALSKLQHLQHQEYLHPMFFESL